MPTYLKAWLRVCGNHANEIKHDEDGIEEVLATKARCEVLTGQTSRCVNRQSYAIRIDLTLLRKGE